MSKLTPSKRSTVRQPPLSVVKQPPSSSSTKQQPLPKPSSILTSDDDDNDDQSSQSDEEKEQRTVVTKSPSVPIDSTKQQRKSIIIEDDTLNVFIEKQSQKTSYLLKNAEQTKLILFSNNIGLMEKQFGLKKVTKDVNSLIVSGLPIYDSDLSSKSFVIRFEQDFPASTSGVGTKEKMAVEKVLNSWQIDNSYNEFATNFANLLNKNLVIISWRKSKTEIVELTGFLIAPAGGIGGIQNSILFEKIVNKTNENLRELVQLRAEDIISIRLNGLTDAQKTLIDNQYLLAGKPKLLIGITAGFVDDKTTLVYSIMLLCHTFY